MAGQLERSDFDYAELGADVDDEKVAALERHAAEILQEQASVRERAALGVIRLGKELAAARDLLGGKSRDSVWGAWVERRCRFSRATAYRAIAASATFGDEKCLTVIRLFDVSALYLLSADSCPEAATSAALRLARKGEPITKKVAQDLRNKYTPAEYRLPERMERPDEAADDDEEGTGEERETAQEGPPVHDEPPPAAECRQDEPAISQEMPSPVPSSPSAVEQPPADEEPPAAPSTAPASVLGALRAAVLALAARTSDRANLVRSLRTLAIPGILHAVAGALQGYPPPAVGNFLSTLAEEIEEEP